MDRLNAIIIHNDTLLSIGLQKILNDMFNIKSVWCSVMAKETNIDDYDLIFTSSDLYVGNCDFFTQRKHKTIILSSSRTDETFFENENIICPTWSEEKIVNVINKKINRISDINSTHNELSKREIDVLKLIVNGYINKEIADKLNISINTVLTHRKNITSKLGIKSVSGLSVYAMMNGYITA